ncbi:HD-GYP domain-containing protein [Marinitoga sp. 1137]|uniref:HD-GYP domain-containing protein n=1 Tax=Marinitoga sp. 1137 TaxID=1545835 RepID=UPI000951DBB0|nr:HD-GYP domain-containing protein [Marinitoga sp. 1137]
MKQKLTMYKITIIYILALLILIFSSFLIISSFLKQKEQIDKFYENIKLTIEVVDSIIINDFENEIIDFVYSQENTNIIEEVEKPERIEKTKFLKNIYDVNLYYIVSENPKPIFLLIYKNTYKYISLNFETLFDNRFLNINLFFDYYIVDNYGNFIYGNRDLYEKNKKEICVKKICRRDGTYLSDFEFFNLKNENLLKIYTFYKPNIFGFIRDYAQTILYTFILVFLFALVFHYIIYKYITGVFKDNVKKISEIHINYNTGKILKNEFEPSKVKEFDEIFNLFNEKIYLLEKPIENLLKENKYLRNENEKLYKENAGIINFLSAFKKFSYGKITYQNFKFEVKKIIEDMTFESEPLKESLNFLFNDLSIKTIENENLKRNYFEQLEILFSVLGVLAEIKEYNYKHVELMGEISILIGKKIKMKEPQLKNLYLGAKIHDLGKSYIPDSILLKKEKLTDEEWEIIKKHPKIGFLLIKEISLKPFSTAAMIIISHHERWDGKGYPYGIEGESIPIESRIVSIIDTFVALITEKPYRKAYTYSEAFKIIEYEKGKKFDPELVDVFLESKEEIINIIQEIKNKKAVL